MSWKLLQYLVLFAGLMLISAGQAAPASPDPPSNDDCLTCHGKPDASSKLGDGEALSLYVDRQIFAHSVHGGKLACTNCHTNITAVPHAARPRKQISATCAQCHVAVGAAYARSAHSDALAKGNADVPVCTDCHRAHDNANPMTTASHLRISELCAHCHTNEKLMAKYGISTQVLTTYLPDFHGMTASLHRSEGLKSAMLTATCTDCHGVHDITWVKGPASGVIKANLLIRCQHCHKGAGPNLSSAWLGHYDPSLRHAPLVYLTKLFYMFFIPFVVGGLIIQILLHLWRVVVNI